MEVFCTSGLLCSWREASCRRTEAEILKLDESCISNPKSEILNWTYVASGVQSNSRFRISDLRCRIRPISKLLPSCLRQPLPARAQAKREAIQVQINNGCRVQREQLAENQSTDNRHSQRPP